MIIDYIHKKMVPPEGTVTEAAATITPRAAPPARLTRSEADTQRLAIPMLVTGKTPQQNVRKKMSEMQVKLDQGRLDRMSKLFLERTRMCSGFHISRTGKDDLNGKGSRGTCDICAAQTHDYCLGCHRWLCASLSAKARDLTDWKPHVIITNPSEEGKPPMHCQQTCQFAAHKQAQEESLTMVETKLLLDGVAVVTPRIITPRADNN